MKRIAFSLIAAALFAGCSTSGLDNSHLPETRGIITFTASIEQSADTKTFLNEEGLLRWNADDRLSIFVGNTLNQQFVFDGETGDNSGTFTNISSSFGTGNPISANYAVYPYRTESKISESGVLSLTLPSTQQYAEGSFGPGANTMVAVTNGTSDMFLGFKNVGGFIKLQIYGDASVRSIELKGNSGENISGAALVTLAYGGEPVTEVNSNGNKTITLDCGDGVTLGATASEATAFYIVVPPIEFPNGFTVTITDTAEKAMVKSTSKKFTVERNIITPMAAFEYEGVSLNANIPDPVFKAYCVANFDTNGDGEINAEEAAVVETIKCPGLGIKSLKGIEYFTALTRLDCDENRLTALDVSRNGNLTYLSCSVNDLSSLDLSENTAITQLYCNDNHLTSLNVKNNANIKGLDCSGNRFTSLDFSGCAALTIIEASRNKLTSLNVSKNTALTSLYCYNNQLTDLDFSNNPALSILFCYNNQLTSLDVSKCVALTELSCTSNRLTSINVSKNPALTIFSCRDNQLTALDVSANAALIDLTCSENPNLTEIWLKEGQSIPDLFYDFDIATIKYK